MRLDLPYLVEDVDRHGNVRVYVRRHRKKTRLRSRPGTDAFLEEYRAAVKAQPARTAPPGAPGSLGQLVLDYYQSAGFRRLDARTQRVRRLILDKVCGEAGELPYRQMEPRHVRELRDEKIDAPEAGNSIVKALRQVFAWAIEADRAAANPAREVPYIRTGSEGFHTWTLEEVEQFEARHPVGSKARLALALLLYTLARRSDVVQLGRQHAKRGVHVFTVTKGRKKKRITIRLRIIRQLQEIIAASPCGSLTYLVTEFGKPFTANGFGNWFRKRCNEAGLPHCSAHGLRKAAAARLAELGITPHQLMAAGGWTTLKEAQRYTEAARKDVLADGAMDLLEGDTGNESVPLSPGVPVPPEKKSA